MSQRPKLSRGPNYEYHFVTIVIIIDIWTLFIYLICYVIHLNLFTETISLVSSDKDQGIQRGMESKRKKCSDQEKEGELSFSYQSLVAVPPVFLTFVSSSMFFGIFYRTFHFGAKHSQNLVKIELEKGRREDHWVDLWSFYLFLTVVLMCLLTIQPGVFFLPR